MSGCIITVKQQRQMQEIEKGVTKSKNTSGLTIYGDTLIKEAEQTIINCLFQTVKLGDSFEQEKGREVFVRSMNKNLYCGKYQKNLDFNCSWCIEGKE